MILWGYFFLGIVLLILNKYLADLNYKLILYYTNKLNISEIFIFKVNHKNRDSLFFLTRSFVIFFALSLIATTSYYLFY